MKWRLSSAWLCVIPLLLSVSWLGSILHESDQASVMLGALRLARGDAPWIGPSFYEYGNYFLSYWLLAACYRLFVSVDFLWLGNALSLSWFWIGTLFCLFSSPRPSTSRGVAFFIALCSPAVLVHVPYFAPIFISVGFLLFGAGWFFRSARNFPGALVCWVAAFACRADAILLVPLLAWLVCEEERLSRLVRSPRSWSLVGAALGVALVGRLVNPGAQVLGYHFFFLPKVYGVYLIFGAAGAAGLLLLLLGGLFQRGARSPEWDRRLFWWGALGALPIPFLFYSLLMTTPRHWVLMICAQLLLVASSRVPLERSAQKVILPALAVASVALFFVGVQLPELSRPALSVAHPELFPSGDGRCPMGSILAFMYSEQRLDHNHQTWRAAQEVSRWEEFEGHVPLAGFPLFDIVDLSIYSRGQRTLGRGADLSNAPFSYISSRAVLKPEILVDTQTQIPFDRALDRFRIDSVGGALPVCLLRFDEDSSTEQAPWSLTKRMLVLCLTVFQGNEVRFLERAFAGAGVAPSLAEGRLLLCWEEAPFELELDGRVYSARPMDSTPDGRLWYVALPAARREHCSLRLSHPVNMVTTVYPHYMNLRAF